MDELENLKGLLRERWDPIGVNETDCPKDEYDSYAHRLFSMLNAGASRDDIVKYLAWVESENMGLSPSDIHGPIADEALKIHEESKR